MDKFINPTDADLSVISSPIKILIADDHTIVRQGLKQILSDTPDMKVVCEVETGRQVLKEFVKSGCNLIMLDISMPDSSTLDLLKEIKSHDPNLPILIYTMYPEEQYAVRFLKAGAAGYLTKESSITELLKAIRHVTEGRKYISSSLAERLAEELERKSETPIHEKLSDREFQVFCLIASGKTVTEIAKSLSLSVATISTYRTRIMEKFKMKNNAQLTHYALRNQLID